MIDVVYINDFNPFLWPLSSLCQRMRKAPDMNNIGGIFIGLILIIYLFVTVFRAEKF